MRWHDGTDLGSIESTGGTDSKWNFQLLEADISKLPTDIAAGSTAYVLDKKIMLVFHLQSKKWYEM